MIQCKFCLKNFSTQANLNQHQRTAKYCLKIQGKLVKNTCSNCNKVYNERYLNDHLLVCPNRDAEYLDELRDKSIIIDIKDRELTELKQTVAVLSTEKKVIKEMMQEVIQDKNKTIEKLQDNITTMALASIKKPSITNILNIQPLTTDWLDEQAQHLSKGHIEAGASGFANLARYHSFHERVVCTDPARKTLRYLDQSGAEIKDSRGMKLARLFFNSIQVRNSNIIQAVCEEIKRNLAQADEKDQCRLIEKMNRLSCIDSEVQISSTGTDTQLKNDFILELCKIMPNP